VELVAELADDADAVDERRPATCASRASRYESPSFERSMPVRVRMTARARGPATFTAASAPVTLTISTSMPQTAFHHSNHSRTAPAPVEVVVT
jgi:hypothetical protein